MVNFAAEKKRLQAELAALEKNTQMANRIAAAANKWRSAGIAFDVVLEGLKRAGYKPSVSSSSGETRSGRRPALTDEQQRTVIAFVKKLPKKYWKSAPEIAKALGLEHDLGDFLSKAHAKKLIKRHGIAKYTRYYGRG